MKKNFFNFNKGQSSLEYMILIIILIGSLLAISMYLKRAIQGRWKESVDNMGDQYDPRYTKSNILYSLESNLKTRMIAVPVGGSLEGKKYTQRIDTTSSIEKKEGSYDVYLYKAKSPDLSEDYDFTNGLIPDLE